MTNTNENTSYTAQQITEGIEAGVEEAPKVDVDADYEKSKEFATSDNAPANTGDVSMATADESNSVLKSTESTSDTSR